MNLPLSMAFRPSSFVILLEYAALTILLALTPCWYVMITRMEKHENLRLEFLFSNFQTEIEYSAELLHPMKSSSTNLARFMSSALNASTISFSDIETKVAPLLFQAFETIPYLAQISFIGKEGFFFSYYTDHDQILAMYSNSSSSSSTSGNASATTLYYIQHVNQDTGKVEATASIYPSINSSWIQETVNVPYGYASMGTTWGSEHDLLFLNSARITTIGIISMGFSATEIAKKFFTGIGNHGTSLYLATKDGKVLLEGIQNISLAISNDTVSLQSIDANSNQINNEGIVSCTDEATGSRFNIQDTEFSLHCHTIDIMGIESVYVLAVPRNGSILFDHNYKKKGLTLLIVLMVMLFIAIFSFIFINARATKREMYLCASLIKQMEATEQAERKNMNKGMAFASASHDVRASLAGLTGLIEMSYELVKQGSELETNLKQMDDCTKDLLGLLNSILDTSKIEAGKMQLEEEEFELSHLLEDVVDLYHPVALKKGVDLVLDPCNGSVIGYSHVKGDRGKLKQVLSNLLNNAVKFTDEGYIVVRAWAQKPSLHNSIMGTRQHSLAKHFWCLFFKKRKTHDDDDLEAMNSTQQDQHCMDFIFEVDDTGRGIPKENHKSVFENYVQMKETALGNTGTGLGLGIVQSLVRLMHGEIGILDKGIGRKGTCFRFNVLLTVCETVTNFGSTREGVEYGSSDRNQTQRATLQSCSSGSSICSPSPRLLIRSSSPRPEPSRVVLLIADEARRRTTQRFMESLGIKVIVVKQWEQLCHALKKIKQKGLHSNSHSSQGSEYLSTSSASQSSLAISRGVPLSSLDGIEYIHSIFKKTDIGVAPGFILIIIDANAGPFSELCRIVFNFRRDLSNPCRVVWLDKPLMRSIDLKTLDRDVPLDPNDIVISKPFHGSRLFQVIKLLPEFHGAWQSSSGKPNRESAHDIIGGNTWRDLSLSKYQSSHMLDRSLSESIAENLKGNQQFFVNRSYTNSKARKYGDSAYSKPLSGKKILVVEDTELLRKVALATLIPLGAIVEQCANGEEAVQLVGDGLIRDFPNPPYDYILMDCQMPVMDGFEATRLIRKMEKRYDIRIPIISLTAHSDKITTEAGMDFHLVKPIKKDHLLEAIQFIHAKN